jgi:transcriptional regulator with XRE-family HTH domain
MAKGLLRALGEELRHRRRDRGLTQDELAARAGLHRNYIGMVERGERNATVLTLDAIATVLKANLADVFAAAVRRQR